ncbi:MAG: hypothetical protein LBV60_13540 [Streptomyces sp.]|jgi:hypothetical protein|nr:hypothetical protein [Streptomyces sp.]
MRPVRASAVALAASVLLGLAAPAALADGNNSSGGDLVATVNPKVVRPGQTVTLTLRNCMHPEEGGRAAGSLVGGETTARTPVEITELTPTAGGVLVGRTTIVNVEPGTTETISFACNSNVDMVAEADITVR